MTLIILYLTNDTKKTYKDQENEFFLQAFKHILYSFYVILQ